MENMKVNISETQSGVKDTRLSILFKDNLTGSIGCCSGGLPLEEIAKPIKECYPDGWIEIDTDDGTEKMSCSDMVSIMIVRDDEIYNYDFGGEE